MADQFFAEYNTVREHRDEIRKAKFSGFLLWITCGMVMGLGIAIALAQFGIYLG